MTWTLTHEERPLPINKTCAHHSLPDVGANYPIVAPVAEWIGRRLASAICSDQVGSGLVALGGAS